MNEYTITDAFEFADEICSIPLNEEDILVSYDVKALFNNIPLSETINILVDETFANNDLIILRSRNLHNSLMLPTPINFFQFDGHLYEQTDGV